MKKSVKKEIKKLMKESGVDYPVKKFKYHVDWSIFSHYQKTSEDFIKEFKDEIDWSCISQRQKLSLDFIYEFRDRLDIKFLIESGVITKKELKELEYKNEINSRFDILDIR